MEEIQASEKVRDEHLTAVKHIVREYVGRWYRGPTDAKDTFEFGYDDAESNPEPFSYSFVTNIMPSLVFENPKVHVTGRRAKGHKQIIDALTSGLNAWIHDIDLRHESEKAVLNFLFFQGVLMHYIEDDTRWSSGAVRPQVSSIDYKTFGIDSMAASVDEAEFLFHHYFVDLDDLQSDPAVIPEALEQLQPQHHDPQEDKESPFKTTPQSSLSRKRVKLYSVWLRRANKIRILCADGKNGATELYQQRDYYGPPTGPYSVFQAYPVPQQAYPLSPLIAVRDQVLDLQVHAKATGRSAAGRKTVIIVGGEHESLADDIIDSKDREVIPVNGFSRNDVEQLELGGATPSQYQYLGLIRDRLDQHSGLTQTIRGNAGQSDTATEASLMDSAFNQRIEYLKARVRRSMTTTLNAVGWFLFHTTGIVIPVNMTDEATGVEMEGLFFGGPTQGQEAGTWEDYEIRIEPMSMQRVNEAVLQRRMMDFFNLVMTTAPLMPQMQWVRWMSMLRAMGDVMNIPASQVDSFFNAEVLAMMRQPEQQLVSSTLGVNPIESAPDRYFSVPGYGFKPKPSSGFELADMLRQETGAEFGRMGGGMQGPPGSRQGPVPGRPSMGA